MEKIPNNLKILIASKIIPDVYDKLNNQHEVIYKPDISYKELCGLIGEFDILLVATHPNIDEALLSKAVRLKLIIRLGIGIDHIDTIICKKMNIKVSITPNANIIPVVELFFSQLIRAVREIDSSTENLFYGNFRSNLAPAGEIFNKKLLIMGVGRIGSKIAKIAKAFDMITYGYDPYLTYDQLKARNIDNPVENYSDVLQEIDIVTFHVPLTKETLAMADINFLKKLKKGTVFVNLSRGQVAPMNTLLDFSANGIISKFIIDVYDNEPYSPQKSKYEVLKKYFLLTPHIGANTRESIQQRSTEAYEIINEYMSGLEPHGLIDLDKGY